MKYCGVCKEENSNDAVFCQNCGAILTSVESPVTYPQTEKRNSTKGFISYWQSSFRAKATIGCGTLLILMVVCIVSVEFYANSPKYQVSKTENAAQTETVLAAPTITATLTPLPTETPVPTATLEPLAALRNNITRDLGESNRGVQRVSDIYWNEDLSELTVTIATDQQSDNRNIIYAIMRDTFNAMETIHQSGIEIPYQNVNFISTYPLVDIYGNTYDEEFVRATYTKETLDKINWVNFDMDNLYDICNQNTLFFHEVLIETWN